MNYSYSTNILVRLLIINMKNFLNYSQNPKMCDPILVTLVKMQPHYSQSGFFLLTSQPNQQRLRLITLTTTLIIPDITKTESNDFFLLYILCWWHLELRYIMYVVTIITYLCHVRLLNSDSSMELAWLETCGDLSRWFFC